MKIYDIKLIPLIVLFIVNFIFFSAPTFAGTFTYQCDGITCDDVFLSNGWGKPLNRTLQTNTDYIYNAPNYYKTYKFSHGGYDFFAGYVGEKVYAIADGVVSGVGYDESSSKNTSNIYIEHTTSSGTKFLALYGHVYPRIGKGTAVKKGDYIGTITNFNSPHVHFAITTNLNDYYYSYPNLWGGIKSGIVDPIKFLKSNKNASAGIKVEEFWKKADPIVVGGDFDAQFKLYNPTSNTITYQNVALSIHKSLTGNPYDLVLLNVPVQILPGMTVGNYGSQVQLNKRQTGFWGQTTFPISIGGELWGAGTYYLVAKVYDGKNWKPLETQTFKVVDVPTKTLNSVSVTCPTNVNENSSASCSAVASFSDGSTASSGFIWSENSAYASINSSSGTLTTSAVSSEQNVTVTATYSYNNSSKSATKAVTIKDVPTAKVLSSLGSDCPPNVVTEGGSVNCQARAYYTDGTNEDVTNRATWSENSNYASIDTSGKLTTTNVTGDQTVTVTASFTSGGVTKSPYAFVTIKDSNNLIAPSNLRVSFSGVNYTIAWNDNSSNEDGFKLEGSTDQVNWRELLTYPANSTSVSGSTAGVASGTKVYYRIRAYLGSIYSAYSNVLEFVVPSTSVQFDNKWKAGQILTVNGNNKWVIVNISGTSAVNICEAASPSKCLNIETGSLQSSTIQSGWLSAQWTLETVDSSYVRIRNLWKIDQYIHWENTNPQAGQIQNGWWSAQWKKQ